MSAYFLKIKNLRFFQLLNSFSAALIKKSNLTLIPIFSLSFASLSFVSLISHSIIVRDDLKLIGMKRKITWMIKQGKKKPL
jgi:hypothetical protein